MDSWTDKQISMMRMGGNAALREWFTSKGVDNNMHIREKYNTPEAELYKERLLAKVEGRPLPTELPKREPRVAAPPHSAPGRQQTSVGGAPLSHLERIPGETEEEYVARQLQLREEAQARLRAKFGPGGLGGGGSRMQGIGSDPSYDPSAGGYGAGTGLDEYGKQAAEIGGKAVSALSSTFSYLSTKSQEVAKKAADTVRDEELQNKLKTQAYSSWSTVQSRLTDPHLQDNLKKTTEKGWNSMRSGVKGLWGAVMGEEEPDLMGALKEKGFEDKGTSKYSGVGAGSLANEQQQSDLLTGNSPYSSNSRLTPYSQPSTWREDSPYGNRLDNSDSSASGLYGNKPEAVPQQQDFLSGGAIQHTISTDLYQNKQEDLLTQSNYNPPVAESQSKNALPPTPPPAAPTSNLQSKAQLNKPDPKQTEEDFFGSFGV
eukprot:CAMPEP_0117744350 /NCGR_PEP_ID=MMETSP0947-20121206/6700_1 /TAXON_ID=44440 /ORGANISM="Chattonella subsalsa, Strain CCMP2191" /LENGTH=429 /DNA_ID=CAMNT_0005561269 /DNA_START=357 /DNA_END=1646 /DNA_ORIENTATION=-